MRWASGSARCTAPTEHPAATAPVGQHEHVLLVPNVGHHDSPFVRRQYQGSTLEISSERVRWVAPAATAYARGGFDVPVGDGPGQARAVTRVQAAFPARSTEGVVDRYAVTDAAGAVLGSFPSGQGVTGSALPEHQAGWYPVAAVQAAVQEAGLLWDDRDFTGDTARLEHEFPGVIPHVRTLTLVAWFRALAYAAGGVVVLALPWIMDGGMSPVIHAVTAVLGALTLAAGIGFTPPMMRRASAATRR